MLKLMISKNLARHFITSRNYTIASFQILDQFNWLLRLKKLRKRQIEKKARFIKKISKIVTLKRCIKFVMLKC